MTIIPLIFAAAFIATTIQFEPMTLSNLFYVIAVAAYIASERVSAWKAARAREKLKESTDVTAKITENTAKAVDKVHELVNSQKMADSERIRILTDRIDQILTAVAAGKMAPVVQMAPPQSAIPSTVEVPSPSTANLLVKALEDTNQSNEENTEASDKNTAAVNKAAAEIKSAKRMI